MQAVEGRVGERGVAHAKKLTEWGLYKRWGSLGGKLSWGG